MRNGRRRKNTLAMSSGAVVTLCLFGLTTWIFIVIKTQRVPVSPRAQSEPHAPHLLLQDTGEEWYGKPIYDVSNQSKTELPQITIQSWSEDFLPVLAIGMNVPSNLLQGRESALHPPFTLPPGEKIWFVGPNSPPTQLVVNWLQNGKEQYEVLQIQGANRTP